MTTTDLRMVHTTIPLDCHHCGRALAVGSHVVLLGHRCVAHLGCALRALQILRGAA